LHTKQDALKSAPNQSEAVSNKNLMSSETGWAFVQGRFNILRDFCGGIATVPENTATVESGFSVLGWEKDEHRKCLSDLALEGIM
jgi:hypothetical protein